LQAPSPARLSHQLAQVTDPRICTQRLLEVFDGELRLSTPQSQGTQRAGHGLARDEAAVARRL